MTLKCDPTPVSVGRAALALAVCAVLFSSCGGGARAKPSIGPSPTPTGGGTAVPAKILAWEVVDQLARTIPPDAGTERAFSIGLNTIFFVQLYIDNPATPNTRITISMQGFWPGVYLPTVITETDLPSGRAMAARHGFQTPAVPNARDLYSIKITLSDGATVLGEETLTINLK